MSNAPHWFISDAYFFFREGVWDNALPAAVFDVILVRPNIGLYKLGKKVNYRKFRPLTSSNITVLAPSHSIWTYEFIANVAIPLGFSKINLVMPEADRYFEYYKDKNVSVYTYYGEEGNIDRKRINSIIKSIAHSDYLHVQWGITSPSLFWKLANISDRHLVSYWGSDLFCARLIEKWINIPMLYRVQKIHLINTHMRQYFLKTYGNLFESKIHTVDFGCSVYNYIDKCIENHSRSDCKAFFDIAPEKIVISVGYNSRPQQNHLDLIKQLNEVEKVYKDNLVVVIPWGYGDNDLQYRIRVEEAIKKTGIDYKILDAFLPYDEVALLRYATDFFMYGQDTDAQSSSFMEYLYAGSIAFVPDWLKYDELDSLGVKYCSYNSFGDISSIINDYLRGDWKSKRKELETNRRVLYNYNSWPAVLESWRSLYE